MSWTKNICCEIGKVEKQCKVLKGIHYNYMWLEYRSPSLNGKVDYDFAAHLKRMSTICGREINFIRIQDT